MNNILITTSSLFIISILFTGTIIVSSPSFMFEAHAQSYQGMDNDRKQVSISSLKYNNINVNVNGLELSVLPPFLGSEVATEAQEGSTDVISFAGNSSDSSEINDFRFICINNNNNTVIEAPAVEDECPEADDIEACFAENLIDENFATLTAALE